MNRLVSEQGAGPLVFSGSVSEAATMTVNGQPATVRADNTWQGTASVTAGTNTVTVVATDASANVRTNQYEVTNAATAKTFTYDANGNLTGDGTRTFEWDAENRLTAVTIGAHRSEFTYDGLDRRVRVVEKENGATVRDARLIWDGTQIEEERLSTGEITRFFRNGEQHNGAARYLTRDHLGSIREVTDGAGTIVTRNEFDPFGRLTRVTGTEDSRFGFTGHPTHTPTGLALAVYRAYEPALARWLNEDPIGLGDGPNLQAYVGNRPTAWRDADGRSACLS
jgi:RHS repeat-associated protein